MVIPIVVAEVTVAFLVGVVIGVGCVSARWVVLASIAIFVLASVGDPLILPVFQHASNFPFLLFWNGMVSTYLILGWAIYEAK